MTVDRLKRIAERHRNRRLAALYWINLHEPPVSFRNVPVPGKPGAVRPVLVYHRL